LLTDQKFPLWIFTVPTPWNILVDMVGNVCARGFAIDLCAKDGIFLVVMR